MDALSVVALGMAKKAMSGGGGNKKYLHNINGVVPNMSGQSINFSAYVISDSVEAITDRTSFIAILPEYSLPCCGCCKYNASAYGNVISIKKHSTTSFILTYYASSTSPTSLEVTTAYNVNFTDNVIEL